MTQNQNQHIHEHHHDGLISALAFGGFLVIVGLVFVQNPNLWNQINTFFNNFTTSKVPFPGSSSSNVVLPAPADPSAYNVLYWALIQFDVGIGFLQVLILGLRLNRHSRLGRIAETVGNMVFWFGAAVLVNIFLLTVTLSGWFEYWAALIILVGVSIVARAVVYFTKR